MRFRATGFPQICWIPSACKTVALYPEPTGAGDPFTHARNYVKGGKSTNLSDRSRYPHRLGAQREAQMFWRLSKAWRQEGRPPPGVWQSLAGTGPISGNPRYQVSLANTFVPEPDLGDQCDWPRSEAGRNGSAPHTYGRDGTEIGLPASFVSQLDVQTIPQFYMGNYSNISHSRELNNISRVANIQVNATKELGAHSLKFGFTRDASMGTGGGQFSADFTFSRGMTSGPAAQPNSTTRETRSHRCCSEQARAGTCRSRLCSR